ncbi:uncharacterized protein LOC113147609 [Cyclospora cayetanensis]|uniref:Uncharacterized protein LOC113147609 n=1 Tax=Cyclospora cayetanensis TaxID=88456 RepID=A0A6P6S459_9EIME|nr:uncharacterized protein LOC113147609 [Cyclospora cayetanensis]
MGALDLNAAYGTFFCTVFGFGLFVVYSGRKESCYRLLHPGPTFLSARNEVSWLYLGLSLYASLMGNWVLYLPAVGGALYGWPGAVGYAISSGAPYLLLVWLAPLVCKRAKGGFCSCDYVALRFGSVAQLAAACISLSMMFVTLSTELTTVGMSMSAISSNTFPVPCAVILVALVPLLYVLVGGLKCCIVSDVVQALIIVSLFVPFTVYLVCTEGGPPSGGLPISQSLALAPAALSSEKSLIAGAVIVASVWPVYLCDQGIWQRVWAARSASDIRKAFLLAGVLSGVSVLLFGVAGIVCLSREEALNGGSLFSYAAQNLPTPWLVVLCVLAVACVTSSVDTYQAAIVSLIGNDLEKRSLSFNWARLAMVLINIPAVLLALYQVPLLSLFMVSNFLCAVLAGPFLVSVHPKITKWGFLGGLACSVVGLLVCGVGASAAAHEPFSLSFFIPDDISSMPYLVSFLVTPLVGAAAAGAISAVEERLMRHADAAAHPSPPPASDIGKEGLEGSQHSARVPLDPPPTTASPVYQTATSNDTNCSANVAIAAASSSKVKLESNATASEPVASFQAVRVSAALCFQCSVCWRTAACFADNELLRDWVHQRVEAGFCAGHRRRTAS